MSAHVISVVLNTHDKLNRYAETLLTSIQQSKVSHSQSSLIKHIQIHPELFRNTLKESNIKESFMWFCTYKDMMRVQREVSLCRQSGNTRGAQQVTAQQKNVGQRHSECVRRGGGCELLTEV